jgi:hypothetical protein
MPAPVQAEAFGELALGLFDGDAAVQGALQLLVQDVAAARASLVPVVSALAPHPRPRLDEQGEVGPRHSLDDGPDLASEAHVQRTSYGAALAGRVARRCGLSLAGPGARFGGVT